MTSPYLNQCSPNSSTHICGIRGRWVNRQYDQLAILANLTRFSESLHRHWFTRWLGNQSPLPEAPGSFPIGTSSVSWVPIKANHSSGCSFWDSAWLSHSNLKQIYYIFQNVFFLKKLVQYNEYFVSTVAWCLVVATVRSMHPCVSSCLGVNFSFKKMPLKSCLQNGGHFIQASVCQKRDPTLHNCYITVEVSYLRLSWNHDDVIKWKYFSC